MNEFLLLIDHLKTGLNSYDLIIIATLIYFYWSFLHLLNVFILEISYLLGFNKDWLINLEWFSPTYLQYRKSIIESYNIIKLRFSIKSK